MKSSGIMTVTAGLLAAALWVAPAEGQLMFEAAGKAGAGTIEVGIAGGMSTVEYDVDDLGDNEIERSAVAVNAAYGLTPMIDLCGALAYLVDVEPEGWHDSGDGLAIAGGLRACVMERDPLAVYAYGQILYLTEDFGEGWIEDGGFAVRVDGENTLMELTIGALCTYPLMDAVTVYAGAEVVAMSEGEVELDAGAMSADYDHERNDVLGVKLGARYDLQSYWLRAELGLINEETILLGAGMVF